MIRFSRRVLFTNSGIELDLFSGSQAIVSWGQVRKIRKSLLGAVTIESGDGGSFLAFISKADIGNLLGYLREASDAHIIGFGSIE